MNTRIAVILTTMMVVLAACSTTPEVTTPEVTTPEVTTPEVTKPPEGIINFSLDFIVTAAHAAYFVAEDQGYYEEQNLRVNIQPSQGSGDSIRRVSVGQADIGLADCAVIINAIRQGADLKIIMQIHDTGTHAVFARAGSGIETLEDLQGKTVGTQPDSNARLVWPAVAQLNGIDWEPDWVDVNVASTFPLLESGDVDAITNATFAAPSVWRVLGGEEKTVMIAYADYDLEFCGHVIFTSAKMLAERRDEVQRFVDASRQGWAFTFDDPAEAIAIEQRWNPAINAEDYLLSIPIHFSHMQTANYRENGFGWIDAEKTQNVVASVVQYFPISDATTEITDANDILTNEFLNNVQVAPPPAP